MRDEQTLQRAHDQLLGILLGDVPLEISDEQRRHMHAAADVLCWILDHDHNQSFASNLQKLEEACKELGFRLPAVDSPQCPESYYVIGESRDDRFAVLLSAESKHHRRLTIREAETLREEMLVASGELFDRIIVAKVISE